MADKDSKKSSKDEQKPRVRKRVQLVDEPVKQAPAQGAAEDGRESIKAEGEFKTEQAAGGKVRVARSTVTPEPAPRAAKPARRAVTVEKKAEEEGAAKASGAGKAAGAKQTGQAEKRGRSGKKGARRGAKGRDSGRRGGKGRSRDAAPQPRVRPEDIKLDMPPVPDVSTADFEALLAGEGASQMPTRTYVSEGDQIEASVVAIGKEFVFVEFGSAKSEGVVKIDDVRDEEGQVQVEVGEKLDLFVLSTRGGEIRLGRKLSGREGAMEAIYTAFETGMPIEGRVAETNKGGFEIAIGGVRAFCPISQIELGYTEQPEIHLGATYQFRVEKIAEEGRNIVVSRSALLEEERAKRRAETLERLQVDQVVSGQVVRVLDFGAFVDIGGIEGLVHISELSHGAVDKVSDLVSEGDSVEVMIQSIEPQQSGDPRISLSIKATQADPWEEVNERFAVGQQVEGTVVRIAPFGAFVEIAPGIDGLVHVSEMSWKRHVKHPGDILSTGDRILVEVQDIDLLRQRIGLSMKAVENDPWDGADERYTVGMEVSGLVENVQDFGAFVRLDSGITALIPRSEMELPGGSTPQRRYTTGADVSARVLNVDVAARKMALTEKAAADIQASSAPRAKSGAEPGRESAPGRNYVEQKSSSMGTLGDLLGKKLQNRD